MTEVIDLEKYSTHDVCVYAASLKDSNLILQSASGGAATALSIQVLDKGGVVAGVSYSEDCLKAEYVLIDKLCDLNKLKGSKVVTVHYNGIFEKIRSKLDKGFTVLFFGLPCAVATLKSYLKKDYHNLILCELICSGRVNENIHLEYINHLKKDFRSELVSFTVRAKNNSWLPEMINAVFKSGHVFKYPFKQTEYGQGFKILKEEGCLKCKYKGNSRQGDIMIGDFWGATEQDVFWNKNGVSVIFAETEKGNEIIKANTYLYLYQVPFVDAVKNNLAVVLQNNPHYEREKLFPIYKKNGLFYAMKKSKSLKKIRLLHKLKRFHLSFLFKYISFFYEL